VAKCDVTVTDADGKRWTMAVEADSRNSAICAYNAEQVCGRYRNYPKLLAETEIEVRVEDGRVFSTVFKRVEDWANREAQRRTSSLNASRRRSS
jgi:hypothetical protein